MEPKEQKGSGDHGLLATGSNGSSGSSGSSGSAHAAGRQRVRQEPSPPSLQTQHFRSAETTLSGEQELIKFTGITEEEII